MQAPRRTTGLPLLAAAVLVLTASCATTNRASTATPDTSPSSVAGPRSTSGPTSTALSPSAVSQQSVPAPTGAAGPAAPAGLDPVQISVPTIGVNASMTDLGIAGDGSIEVPSDVHQAGWLDTSPVPGEQGPAVVAGHVDSTTGPAVFYRLSSLTPGDPITITRQDGSSVRFTVDEVRSYAKNRFPTDAVYGPVPVPSLRLITCGGDFLEKHGGYQDNVVVFAS